MNLSWPRRCWSRRLEYLARSNILQSQSLHFHVVFICCSGIKLLQHEQRRKTTAFSFKPRSSFSFRNSFLQTWFSHSHQLATKMEHLCYNATDIEFREGRLQEGFQRNPQCVAKGLDSLLWTEYIGTFDFFFQFVNPFFYRRPLRFSIQTSFSSF